MNAGIEMLGTQKLFLVNSVLSISFKKEEITWNNQAKHVI